MKKLPGMMRGALTIAVTFTLVYVNMLALDTYMRHRQSAPYETPSPPQVPLPSGNPSPPSSATPTGTPSPEPTRPNVLIIFTDDQRALPLAVLRTLMPNLASWMIDGGRYYPNAFATTPLCCPSRASLFTGQYAHNHGIRTNQTDKTLLDQRTTIQYYLSNDAGYYTGFIGKYFNHTDVTQRLVAFDDWIVAASTSKPDAYNNRDYGINGVVQTVTQYTTDFQAERAVDFIERREREDARPWYLEVATNAPHAPFKPSPRYAKAAVPDWFGNPSVGEKNRSDKPSYVQQREVNLTRVRAHATQQMRMLKSVDDLIGRIFGALADNGELNETLVVFSSDNGYLWGEHGLAGKIVPYTESIRVPLFLRWPGVIPAGSTDTRLAGNIDIAPTILDAIGFDPARLNEAMDGQTLLGNERRNRLFFEAFPKNERRFGSSWLSIRTHRYQYIVYYNSDGTVRFREYYNLVQDPWQLHNLLKDGNPKNNPILQPLNRLLRHDARCSGSSCP